MNFTEVLEKPQATPQLCVDHCQSYIFALCPLTSADRSMKPPTACKQCREAKRRCIRRGAGEACVTCEKRQLRCGTRGATRDSTNILPKPPIQAQLSPPQESVSSPTPELTPSLAQELVEYYLLKIHDRPHSIFHLPTIRDSVRDGTINRALLLSLCSMGCRFSADYQVQNMELSLLDESKRLLQADLENICLENIQTCILIANLCASHGNPSSEALYFRIGNSMAQIMRLNSPTSTGSIVEREIERRVWWSLFMADRWSSAGIGLPRQIKDLGGNIDLPMDESVFHSLPQHLTRHEGTWKPGLWAHMISLVQHFGPIQDLNRQSAQGCFDGWELDRTAAELSQKLDLWEKMLPTDAKETDQNFRLHQTKGTGGPFVGLHLGYHHYSTLLYFRYLEARNSVTEFGQNCVSRCKHHASAYSALLRMARESEGCEAVYPTVGHMAVVSSSVLLHTLLFGDENELANARRDLNSNFAALMELKQYWANTTSMISRLVTFQNVCLLSAEYTHRLDGWMVRFLIEHSLPLADKTLQTVPSGIEMNTDSLSIRAQELQQQGRYTNFELSGPIA